METISYFVDLVLHIDKHLAELARDYGTWLYGILFAIVFVETGIVFFPFLPGDSLLFGAGVVAGWPDSKFDSGKNPLNPHVIFGLLVTAAFVGDQCNYWIGKFLGPRLLRDGHSRWLKKKHLDRTHAFFEKYGGKTIIMARFVPIVRTFAPFVAGIGAMTYRRFVLYDIFGAVLWVGSCTYAGYFFGGIEFVSRNFSVVVLAIIAISVLPMAIEFLRIRAHARRERAAATAGGDEAA